MRYVAKTWFCVMYLDNILVYMVLCHEPMLPVLCVLVQKRQHMLPVLCVLVLCHDPMPRHTKQATWFCVMFPMLPVLCVT